jgi:transposase-like protein
MRYTKEEKLEIIKLVESSDLPLKRTVKELNVSKSTFYSWYNKFLEGGPDALEDKKCRSTWNKIPESYRTKVIEVALDRSGDSPREVATFMTDNSGHFISESSVYRILKAVNLITSPNHILVKAANEFKDKTTRIHQMWQTDFTYFKVEGWGWFYLSSIMDDYSRFIIHHELCTTMKTPDVERNVEAALIKTGLPEGRRPKILSDNGSCYISEDIKAFMKEKGITQVHGAPNHPQTQGKIERYHRSMKNVVKLHHYYSLSDLKKAIDEYIEYYNNERYHESLNNCTPASVYNSTNKIILEQRRLLKQKSMKQRRRNHLRSKSAIFFNLLQTLMSNFFEDVQIEHSYYEKIFTPNPCLWFILFGRTDERTCIELPSHNGRSVCNGLISWY